MVCLQGVLQLLSCSGGHYTYSSGELCATVPLYMYNGQLAVLAESIPVVWFLFTQLSAPVGFGMCVFI